MSLPSIGASLREESVGHSFTALLTIHRPKFKNGAPLVFHQILSLSNAIRTINGIDTLALRHHASEKIAKSYADPSSGWIEVKIPKLACSVLRQLLNRISKKRQDHCGTGLFKSTRE